MDAWVPMPQQQAMRVDGHEGAGHGGSGSYGGGDRGEGGEGGGWGLSPGQQGLRETGSITGQTPGTGGGGEGALGSVMDRLGQIEALLGTPVPGLGFLDDIRQSRGYKAHQTSQVGSLLAGPFGAALGLLGVAAHDWANATPEERETMRAEARAATAEREARQAAGDTGDQSTNRRRTSAEAEGEGDDPAGDPTFEALQSRIAKRLKEMGIDPAVRDTTAGSGGPDSDWLNPFTSTLDRARERITVLGAF